ncbi:phosphohexomutase domain-containing protein [Halopenitus persicus]|uniref:phosphoglucomutase n=1 Tax=Halopenitus persicus TaxID=1048396 RepID=UPI000BBA78FC|nr:phosphoglucomutase [Halopenitus persicus]
MDGITFGTGGWRAAGDEFTDERVRAVGQAVATYLRETESDSGGTVAVGYDARATSEDAAESLADVLSGNGFDVLLTDRDRPTPVLAYAVADRGLDGGVMVTASHNPPEYNGVKFIPSDANSAMPAVTEAIEARLEPPRSLPKADHGSVERFDPVSAHATHARDLVADYLDIDLSGLTVVYDAIHGSGRGVTDALLEDAGATVIRRRCDRDPTFGGQAPEPGPETLAGLPEAVADHDADLGIANDGDADRISICTPERGVLNGHLLFAGVFDALLEDAGARGPAVRTVSTTFLIDRIAAAHDVAVHEVPVGFKWVADGMVAHDGLFGGEESGGYTVRGHIGTKDGVLIALLAAAAAAAEPFDDRIDRLFETHGRIYADKRSVACEEAAKPRLVEALEADVPDLIAGEPVAETVTVDGFKFLLDDGSWILLRPSGTEPKIRVYAETTDPDRLEPLLEAGSDLVAARLGGTKED